MIPTWIVFLGVVVAGIAIPLTAPKAAEIIEGWMPASWFREPKD